MAHEYIIGKDGLYESNYDGETVPTDVECDKSGEQPIINGVDVSRCEFLLLTDDEHDTACLAQEYHHAIVACSACPTCYYKQLQKVKAENERLAKQLEIYDEEDITVQISQNQFEEYKCLKKEFDKRIKDIRTEENQDKKVYKLGSKYFNIDQLQEVSEISIKNPIYKWRSKANAYAYMTHNNYEDVVNQRHYDPDCKSIHITINGIDHSQVNYEEDCGIITLIKVTEQKQKIFDEFKVDAEELLSAFRRR